MDNSSENNLGTVSGNTEARPFSVGAVLREAREQHGLSVADVESRLKFPSPKIEALEADNFTLLSGNSFVRLFVRSYAKLLQLDPDPLLAALPETQTQPSLHSASNMIGVPIQNAYVSRGLKSIWLATGLVVIAVILVFVWLNRSQSITPQARVEVVGLPAITTTPPESDAMEEPSPDELDVSPETLTDANAIQSKSNSASKKSGAIRLIFDEESWVKVTDSDGKVLLSQLNSRGSEKHLNGRPPYSVVVGNVGGVRVYYKEKRVDFAPSYPGGIANLTLE